MPVIRTIEISKEVIVCILGSRVTVFSRAVITNRAWANETKPDFAGKGAFSFYPGLLKVP